MEQLLFQPDRPGEQNIIFQVFVLHQVGVQFLQLVKDHLVVGAGLRFKHVVIGEFPHLAQQGRNVAVFGLQHLAQGLAEGFYKKAAVGLPLPVGMVDLPDVGKDLLLFLFGMLEDKRGDFLENILHAV